MDMGLLQMALRSDYAFVHWMSREGIANITCHMYCCAREKQR
jgi:hypothetical protein